MSWNNKNIGSEFEKKVVNMLSEWRAWVHFITPDKRGAQPFDIIAVKKNVAMAVECKTLSPEKRYFSIARLEENQKMAFEKWISCGNQIAVIFVEYGDKVVTVDYLKLKEQGRIDIRNAEEGVFV